MGSAPEADRKLRPGDVAVSTSTNRTQSEYVRHSYARPPSGQRRSDSLNLHTFRVRSQRLEVFVIGGEHRATGLGLGHDEGVDCRASARTRSKKGRTPS
jgi:hypothetical protein